MEDVDLQVTVRHEAEGIRLKASTSGTVLCFSLFAAWPRHHPDYNIISNGGAIPKS